MNQEHEVTVVCFSSPIKEDYSSEPQLQQCPISVIIMMLTGVRAQIYLKHNGGFFIIPLLATIIHHRTLQPPPPSSSAPKTETFFPSPSWVPSGKINEGGSSSSIRIRSMASSFSSSDTAVSADANVHGVKEIELLDATEDWYGGLTMEVNDPIDAADFAARLRYSISRWKKQGKKGIWIKLPTRQSNLVHPVIQEGFRFHHAESDYVMLVRWLPEHLPDTLPINASHRVGVGALVVNENKEVLVVTERHGGFEGTGYWKLPTGVVEEGEDIWAAAVREVKEETGIDAEFVEMLTFRQSHKSFFSKSDLMFVCMLRPLSANITAQQSEIEAAKWMPVNEYVEQPYNQKHGQFRSIAEICKAKVEGAYAGFSAMPVKSASGKKVDLYYNNQQVQNKL